MNRGVRSAMTLFVFAIMSLCASLLQAQAPIQVVNAASYAPSTSFAPGTIVSIMGANLTNTILAAPNPANPPTSLGGISVTIGGVPAGLFFVSPNQINAHIDNRTPLGAATVTVTTPTGTFSTNITISINVAAGLFSLAGTGSSEGAIVNAITFARGPFTVTSPMGPTGSPMGPTYLAIFLTGLDLSASPSVTVGGVQVPVAYFGNAPCCVGLEQINVQLVSQLAGAGTVPVVVTAAGQTSNVVDVTILPNSGQGTTQTVHQLSGVVVIPNKGLGLIADSTDDVVQVVNTSTKNVVSTIRLPQGAQPGRIAVSSDGSLAVVVEHKQNAVAFLNLSTFQVLGQANVGHGPVSVTIVDTRAFVVNQDSDNVTVLDLASFVVLSSIPVGRAPSSISVDTARNRLLVTNSGSGTISVIDLGTLKVTGTVPMSSTSRPLSIRVLPSVDIAVVTDATLKPGQMLVIDLLHDTSQMINVPGTQAGSWNAIAVMGAKVFATDSVDGVIGVVTFSRNGSGQITFQSQRINAAPGIQTLSIDAGQNLLIVVESNGKVLLFDLNTNSMVASVSI